MNFFRGLFTVFAFYAFVVGAICIVTRSAKAPTVENRVKEYQFENVRMAFGTGKK